MHLNLETPVLKDHKHNFTYMHPLIEVKLIKSYYDVSNINASKQLWKIKHFKYVTEKN
jgi:hypothetical protein